MKVISPSLSLMIGLTIINVSASPAQAIDGYVVSGTGTTTSCATGNGGVLAPPGTFSCPAPLNAPRDFTFSFSFGLAPDYAIEPGGSVSLFADANPAQQTILLGQGSPVSDYNGFAFTLGATSSGTEPQIFSFDYPQSNLPIEIGSSVNGSNSNVFYSTCNSNECKTQGQQRINGFADIDFTITRVPGPISGLALAPIIGVLGLLRKRYSKLHS